MTLRLIGLMSVVLFISLSAFSFLLSRSQDAIMEEVTETVSTVGSKTLQVFGVRDSKYVTYSGDAADGLQIGIDGRFDGPLREELRQSFEQLEIEAEMSGREGQPEGKGLFVVRLAMNDTTIVGQTIPPDPPEGAPVSEEGHWRFEEGQQWGGGGAVLYFSDGVVAEVAQGEVQARIPVLRKVLNSGEGRTRVDVRLGPAGRTPRDVGETEIRLVNGVDGEVGAAAEDGEDGDQASSPRTATYREELTFGVPMHDYESIFDAIQDRMLFLFLGVLVVGTVLSAGLARRFTRPIRQLDRGLHQLSSGDLDVHVEIKGRDEVARLGSAFNDMTRRIRAGRERAQEVTRKEKLSALGRLAAGVAHDVRNPLHSINLTLQHLQDTCTPDTDDTKQEFDRSLTVIRDEIRRLDRLVGNFLQFARSDRLARQPVDLGGLLDETGQLVQKEAEMRGITVVIDAADDLAPIDANVESLRSALLNLVLNSFEAMPDGGTVTLRSSAAGAKARIEVIDTGLGIGKEDRERVFEFGYTTRAGGHGLGLAMVHQIVAEEHGGQVALESRPGEGTRIRLDFPRDEEGTES